MRVINATSGAEDVSLSPHASPPTPGPDASPLTVSDEWVARRSGALHWRVRRDWTRLLDDGCSPDWEDLEHEPRASLIKGHAARQVWRVAREERDVFVKVYRARTRRQRLRWLVSGTPGARECRVARYGFEHGIRTVVPLALGDSGPRSAVRSCVLITAAEPDARPLQELWPTLDPASADARRLRRRIIDEVARLLARAHQSGFQHLDLHAGNVLIRVDARGIPEAIFVDLHNVRAGRPVRDRAVLRDLARFNQWFSLQRCTTDRFRFLRRYLHWRDLFEDECVHGRRLHFDHRGLVHALGRMIQEHANALYAKRDRRGMRSGRYFTSLELGDGWHAHVFLSCKHPVPGSRVSGMICTADQWRRVLAEPASLMRQDDRGRILKESVSSTVCRQRLPIGGGDGLEVVCKRYTPRNIWRGLQGFFRTSRPMRTWRRANALLNRGIPTARPLAVLEKHRFGLLRDSIVIVEYIDHAHDLDVLLTLVMRLMPEARQRALKAQLCDAVVEVIRKIGDRGLIHRDFKAPNIIVQWDPDVGEPPRIILVDLDGVKRRRGDDVRTGVVRMLARLDVSLDSCRRVTLGDRLRFLKHCLARTGGDPGHWKPVWRDIARRSSRKRELRARFRARVFGT